MAKTGKGTGRGGSTMNSEIGHPTIESVGERGITAIVHGESRYVSWDSLRAAASDDNAEDLRGPYRALLREAEQIAITKSPLLVCYGQDSTNVWWHAWVETAWGGIHVGRTWHTMRIVAADEGGTLAHAWMARQDAEAIVARIAKIAPSHTVRMVAR